MVKVNASELERLASVVILLVIESEIKFYDSLRMTSDRKISFTQGRRMTIVESSVTRYISVNFSV